MGLTEHVRVKVRDLAPGDVVRCDGDTAWVTVLKVKADKMGHDMLYEPFNAEPRWRGFDDGDSVTRKQARVGADIGRCQHGALAAYCTADHSREEGTE